MNDYWKACLEASFDEHGIIVSDATLAAIAEDMQMAREMESESCGYLSIPDPRDTEIKTLKRSLETEMAKSFCITCQGTGRITESSGVRSSNTQCWKCRGEGKV